MTWGLNQTSNVLRDSFNDPMRFREDESDIDAFEILVRVQAFVRPKLSVPSESHYPLTSSRGFVAQTVPFAPRKTRSKAARMCQCFLVGILP